MKFRDKYGNVKPWVENLGYMIAVVGIFAAAAGTVGLSVNKINNAPDPEFETITITSKDQQDVGIQCFEFITLNCWHNYDYYINGVETSSDIYNSVEVGKTYSCEKLRYNRGYRVCKEAHE